MSCLPLLMDDLLERAAARVGYEDRDFRLMCNTPVYELTECRKIAQLVFDDASDLQKYPKRPPFENVWTEWQDNHDGTRVTVGVLIWDILEYTLKHIHSALQAWGTAVPPKHCYIALVFSRIDSIGGRPVIGKPGKVYLHPSRSSFAFWDDCGIDMQIAEHIERGINDKIGRIFADEVDSGVSTELGDITSYALPAFACFALLHCQNIVAEQHTPSKLYQKTRKKAGKPRRVSYRVLKIEVPHKKTSHRTMGASEQYGPKVRLHMCSGHMRHLTSDCYKAKKGEWIFIPAHLRGSDELGEVHGPRKATFTEK